MSDVDPAGTDSSPPAKSSSFLSRLLLLGLLFGSLFVAGFYASLAWLTSPSGEAWIQAKARSLGAPEVSFRDLRLVSAWPHPLKLGVDGLSVRLPEGEPLELETLELDLRIPASLGFRKPVFERVLASGAKLDLLALARMLEARPASDSGDFSLEDLPILLQTLEVRDLEAFTPESRAQLSEAQLSLGLDRVQASARGQFLPGGPFDGKADLSHQGGKILRASVEGQTLGLPLDLLAPLLAARLPGARAGGSVGVHLAIEHPQGESNVYLAPQQVRLTHPRLPEDLILPSGKVQWTSQGLTGLVPVQMGRLHAEVQGSLVPPNPQGSLELKVRTPPTSVETLASLVEDPALKTWVEKGQGELRAFVQCQGTGEAPACDFEVRPEPELSFAAGPGTPALTLRGQGLKGTPEKVELEAELRVDQARAAEVRAQLAPVSAQGVLDLEAQIAGFPLGPSTAWLEPLTKALLEKGVRLEASRLSGDFKVRRSLEEISSKSLKGLLAKLSLSGQGDRAAQVSLGGKVPLSLTSAELEIAQGSAHLVAEAGSAKQGQLSLRTRPQDHLGLPLVARVQAQNLWLSQLLPGFPEETDLKAETSFDVEVESPQKILIPAHRWTLLGSHPQTGRNPFTLDLGPTRVSPDSIEANALRGKGFGIDLDLAQLGISIPPGKTAGKLRSRGKLLFDLGDLPSPLRQKLKDSGLQVSGRIRVPLDLETEVASGVLPPLELRSESIRLSHPRLPGPGELSFAKVALKEGKLWFEPASFELPGLLAARITGKVSAQGADLEVQVPKTGVATWLRLGGAPLPEAVRDLEGQLGVVARASGSWSQLAGNPWGLLQVDLKPDSILGKLALGDQLLPVGLRSPGLELRGGALDLSQVALLAPVGGIQLTGKLRPAESEGAEVGFQVLEAPRMLSLVLPEGVDLSGNLGIQGSLKLPRAESPAQGLVRLKSPHLELQVTGQPPVVVESFDIPVQFWAGETPRFEVPISGETLRFGPLAHAVRLSDGKLSGTSEKISVRTFKVSMGQGSILQLDGEVTRNLAGPWSLEGMKTKGVVFLPDLPPLFAWESSRKLTGKLEVQADVLGNSDAFVVRGRMKDVQPVRLEFHSTTQGNPFVIPLEELQVPFVFSGRKLQLMGLSSKVYGAQVGAQGLFDFSTDPFQLRSDWEVKGLDLGRFVKESMNLPGGVRGRVHTSFVLEGKGTDTNTLTLTGDDGLVENLVLEGAVLGEFFGLKRELDRLTGETAADPNRKLTFGNFLKDVVLKKAVEKIDALRDYRDHLIALMSDHAYPSARFQFGAPIGHFGLKKFWIPSQPGLFEGNFLFNLLTLDMLATLTQAHFRYKDDCRIYLKDVRFGGKVTAPQMLDPLGLIQNAEKRCGGP